jgi:hypothetical protein
MMPAGVHGASTVSSPDGEPAGVDGVEAVHVLGRVDGHEDLRRVDVLRQRQLHEDAVHVGIRVESVDDAEQLVLRRVSGSVIWRDTKPAFSAAFPFIRTYTSLAGSCADEHDGQARASCPSRAERGGLLGDLRAHDLAQS